MFLDELEVKITTELFKLENKTDFESSSTISSLAKLKRRRKLRKQSTIASEHVSTKTTNAPLTSTTTPSTTTSTTTTTTTTSTSTTEAPAKVVTEEYGNKINS